MGIERGREMGVERETNQKKQWAQRERERESTRIVCRQLRKIIKKLEKKNILLKYCVNKINKCECFVKMIV